MTFHMATAVQGKRTVSATLVNATEQSLAHGYVVVTLINKQCKPIQSVMQTFGPMPAGEKRLIQVPIAREFHNYRLASLAAFDEQGFAMPVKDTNAALLKAREAQEREYCQQAQAR